MKQVKQNAYLSLELRVHLEKVFKGLDFVAYTLYAS